MKWLVLGAFLGLVCLAQGRDADDGRFVIAMVSTETAIIITTSTTSAFYTCNSAANAATCQRRRLRRMVKIDDDDMDQEKAFSVDGSLQEKDDFDDIIDEDSRQKRDLNRDPRVALTMWSTVTTTYTVTSTSINSSSTFSLSYFCSVSGASFPPACG